MSTRQTLISILFFLMLMFIISLVAQVFGVVTITPSAHPIAGWEYLIVLLVSVFSFCIGTSTMSYGYKNRIPLIEWGLGLIVAAVVPIWLWLLAGEYFRWEIIQSLNLPISDITLALDGNSVGTLFVMLAYGGVSVTFHLLNTRD